MPSASRSKTRRNDGRWLAWTAAPAPWQAARMQIGVVFPQTEIGADRGAIRDYATGVEELGFTHLLAYDHVLGADPAVHPGWSGPYDIGSTFHEPLVLFGYLAAGTSVELVTGRIILPQRQPARARALRPPPRSELTGEPRQHPRAPDERKDEGHENDLATTRREHCCYFTMAAPGPAFRRTAQVSRP